jgi:putative SOS response-associated peptidase YedK
MCGRYTLRVSPAELAEIFGVLEAIEWSPRYNIAPTQTVAAVRSMENGNGRRLSLLKWGLVPSWADDPKIGSNLINARAETVATKPAFRTALRKKRCLVPADGFYEWQAVPGRKTKQPFFIGVRDVPVFAFAGLWEHWTSPEGTPLETCTIITTEANELMRPVHNRMPVILDPQDYGRWLDRDRQDPQEVLPLLRPYPAEKMQLIPVSTLVNSPRNDRPDCVQPQSDPASGGC